MRLLSHGVSILMRWRARSDFGHIPVGVNEVVIRVEREIVVARGEGGGWDVVNLVDA